MGFLKEIQLLRELFLKEEAIESNYWNHELLEAYDKTLAERIRWKWQHVMRELELRNLSLTTLFPEIHFEDWACGTGAASSVVAKVYKLASFSFFDRSHEAMRYAEKKISDHRTPISPLANKVRLLSYVLSELSETSLEKLLFDMKSVDAFIWVDSGSKAMSARLVKCREKLREDFLFLAPCPHSHACPLRDNAKDWCHSFATPPQYVFHSAEWTTISKELGFDLRSLPFHYLFGVKKKFSLKALPLTNRILGRPRLLTNFARVDVCTEDGIYKNIEIAKSKNKKLYSRLKKENLLTLDDKLY